MKISLIKATTLAALTTAIGVGIVENNVLADNNTGVSVDNSQSTQQQNQVTLSNIATKPTAYTSALYSASLNTQNVQYINFPQGYNLDTLRGINNHDSASNFQTTTIAGMGMNNYQSDSNAAREYVNMNNLSPQQTIEMNQYAVGLVNQTRSEFGLEPFELNDETIDAVRVKALQYQSKNESILTGSWHDPEILQNHSENISAQQIYNDNITGLVAQPFSKAKGSDFIHNNQVPLFSVNTMDDLRAMVFYGFTGMLFNDADDTFGHAQNFLTNPQSINTLGVYPSMIRGVGTGTYQDGSHFNFNLLNVDIHYIWVEPVTETTNPNHLHLTNSAGWHQEDGNWHYYNQDGFIQTGWQWVNGHWYYLENGTGNMVTGVKNIGKSTYYFENSGAMQTGWQRVNNNWYFFQNNGSALTGWQFINGHWYYFSSQGIADTNWQTINGHRYYFDLNNAWALTGWQPLNNNWYYFDPLNAWMNSGWQWLNGWYYFDSNYGQMLSGLQIIDNNTYFLNTQHDGTFGVMRTGWWNINNSWYFFYNNGSAAKGWFQSGAGNWYYFDNNGKANTGWQSINGRYYYFDPINAWADRGFQLLNNHWYYFDPANTWMNTRWQWIGNNWFYMDPSTGQMQSGLQTINGQKYYLTTQHNGLFGAMMTGWQKINSKWYYFNESGAALIGWQKINGHYYHFKNNGEADTGNVYLMNNGQSKLYHFDEQNAWLD